MDMKEFSQVESKLITDWLRSQGVRVPRADIAFWRKSPTEAATFIKKNWSKEVSAEDVARAAGRDD
jgi:hypothetical protein